MLFFLWLYLRLRVVEVLGFWLENLWRRFWFWLGLKRLRPEGFNLGTIIRFFILLVVSR